MGAVTREEPTVESFPDNRGALAGNRRGASVSEMYKAEQDTDAKSKVTFNDREVYAPPHYTSAEIECIDAIRAQLCPIEFRGFLRGQIAKYNWRLTSKHPNPDKDAGKLLWYSMLLAGKDPRKS